MPRISSAKLDQQRASRLANELVALLVPFLLERLGPPGQHATAGESPTREGSRVRTAASDRQSSKGFKRLPSFAKDVVDIAACVLQEQLGLPTSESEVIASDLAGALSQQLRQCKVFIPSTEFLLKRGAFDAPPVLTEPVTSRHLKWQEFIGRFVQCGVEILRHRCASTNEDAARSAALLMARRFCELNARLDLYVAYRPSCAPDEVCSMFAQDSPVPGGPRKFTGQRASEIAVARGLSVQHVYRILRANRSASSGVPGSAAPT